MQSEKLFELVKAHTDNGLWIKNPLLTEKERRRVINIDQIETAQNKTLCEAIEEYLKAGMPKIKRGGYLSARSAKSMAAWKAQNLLLNYFKLLKNNIYLSIYIYLQ